MSDNFQAGGDESKRLFSYKNSSMELAWFAPQSQKSQGREIGTLPKHKEAISINFLPGALPLTKNKSRD